MIDWWALRWMSPSSFAELAQACGLPFDALALTQFAASGLVPPLSLEGDTCYAIVHLVPLWAYGRIAVTWRHPWDAEPGGPLEQAALDAFRERFRPFRDWLGGLPYDPSWWDEIEAEVRRHHPLGRARHMGLLLDLSVLESVTGEARLFLELDRFFASWDALLEQRRGDGLPAPTAAELRQRPELASTSGPYPPVQRPPAALDQEELREPPRRTGLDEEALRTGRAPAPAAAANGAANGDVLSPGEAAREHARRAAEETSALIPLAVAAKRSNTAERLTAFEARERALFEQQEWAELAEHYRASLDLFDDDAEVGRLLKKLALVHLDRLDQVAEGTDFYLRALERLPTDRVGLETVNELLAEQDRWEELAAIWQRTATHAEGPQSSEAWMRVASILLQHLHNMPDAIQALRFALEADPSNTEARQALSNMASLSPEERSGSHALETTRAEWTRLATIAERWARRQENDEEAADWYERAAELYLSGRDGADPAFACLEAALERDPERLDALARLESLARHQDRWDAFDAVMRRFIERETTEGNELHLSLVAETLRERLKTGGVPEDIYGALLERLPPSKRPREARPPAGPLAELARRIIEEATEPTTAPVPAVDAGAEEDLGAAPSEGELEDGGHEGHHDEQAEAEALGAEAAEEPAAEGVPDEDRPREDGGTEQDGPAGDA